MAEPSTPPEATIENSELLAKQKELIQVTKSIVETKMLQRQREQQGNPSDTVLQRLQSINYLSNLDTPQKFPTNPDGSRKNPDFEGGLKFDRIDKNGSVQEVRVNSILDATETEFQCETVIDGQRVSDPKESTFSRDVIMAAELAADLQALSTGTPPVFSTEQRAVMQLYLQQNGDPNILLEQANVKLIADARAAIDKENEPINRTNQELKQQIAEIKALQKSMNAGSPEYGRAQALLEHIQTAAQAEGTLGPLLKNQALELVGQANIAGLVTTDAGDIATDLRQSSDYAKAEEGLEKILTDSEAKPETIKKWRALAEAGNYQALIEDNAFTGLKNLKQEIFGANSKFADEMEEKHGANWLWYLLLIPAAVAGAVILGTGAAAYSTATVVSAGLTK